MTVLQLVDRERSAQRRLLGAAGVLAGLAAIALLIAAGAVALGSARWITRPAVPLVLWSVALGLVAGALWWTRSRVRRDASRAAVAAAIEREQSLRSGALRGALEVERSGSLGRRGAELVASRLTRDRAVLAPGMRRTAMLRGAAALAAAVVAVAVLGAARAVSPDGWRAVTHPVGAFRGTLLPALEIVDLPDAVLRGERVRLRVSAEGRRSVTLHSRATGSAWSAAVIPVVDGRAEAIVGPLDADLVLVAGDGRALSDTVTIRVADRPFLDNVAMRAIYPSYLGRAPEPLPAGELARLPRGTVIELRGRASTELRDVRLVLEDDSVAMRVDGHTFAGRLVAERSGRWTWLAQGVRMPVTDVPPPLELEVLADSAPRVEILSPRSDTLVAVDDQLALRVAATDDHGLANIVVRSWRRLHGGADQPVMAQRLAEGQSTQWSGEAPIDLAARGLEPGDALHVVVAATDDSPWAQTGLSRELVIRVPSLAEQRAIARALGDSAVADAVAAAESQRSLERRTGDAARARDRSQQSQGESEASSSSREQAMSYENAEQAKALSREQREMQERVQQLGDAAKQLEEQLRRAGALDSALASQLAEVRSLLQQALTPELEEKLRSLEGALQQLSQDDARRSMAELQEQQRKLREQLERSAEMLRRAALEGSMETLKDDARELAQQERSLADSVARSGQPRPDEARDLANRSSDLAQEISKLTERLEREKAEPGAQRTRTAEQQAQQSAEAMQRAAQQGSENRPNEQSRANQQNQQGQTGRQGQQQQNQQGQQQGQQGQQGQNQAGQQGDRAQSQQQAREQSAASRQAGEAMERAAQSLEDAREQQIGQWKSELTGELDQAIQEMMQLARQQQGLEQRAQQGADPQSLRAEQSAVQQGLDQASQRLDEQGRKSSLLSPGSQRAVDEARREVSQATQAAEGRSGQQTASAMREAGESLNRAAASLVRDRERAERAQSASGFSEMIEQLQQLAQQQGSLNAQASGLMQMPMGQAGQRADDLARQQRELARELDDVGDLDGSGRARELAREARQIADAIEGGRIDAQTLARQQQLFRRLLDAGRTLEQDERDDTGKREARSASGTERYTPAGEAAGRAVARFREPTWEELRGLTAEERRAVLDYFKRINAPPDR